MKLLSFKQKNGSSEFRMGTIIDEQVVDLQLGYQVVLESEKGIETQSVEELLPSDPGAFFSLGDPAIEKAQQTHAYIKNNRSNYPFIYNKNDVSLGVPVPAPEKIICVGRNYADHATEMNSELPDHPVLFAKYPTALIGPEDEIEKSAFTEQLDYEVELTVVIGKEASQVKKEDAASYIAGYTIGNDITARDLQKRTPQWLQGKSLDNSTPIGPWVVTADEVENPANLSVRTYVNKEKRQDSNTSKFIFDIPYLIEFISHLITLKPGDIILTGTPDGVGVAMTPPRFLTEGDIVQSEISEIGSIKNKVVNG